MGTFLILCVSLGFLIAIFASGYESSSDTIEG